MKIIAIFIHLEFFEIPKYGKDRFIIEIILKFLVKK